MSDSEFDRLWLGKFPRGTLHEPLGFEQGDPLVVCRSDLPGDLHASFTKLNIRAYYCGYMSMVCARRHDKIIFDIHNLNMPHGEFVHFGRWISENVMTCTPPQGAEFIFV